MVTLAHVASAVHDGERLLTDAAVTVRDGICVAIGPAAELPPDMPRRRHAGILCPAFVDLQANGGGGLMFNDATDADGLRAIAAAHARLGTGAFLPTLITDTPQRTRAAVQAVMDARDPIVAGLHLEGPHLSQARKGAHDPALIRAMTDADLGHLCDAARALPALMVTVAPEAVSLAQIAALSAAGAIVSLGHTDADYTSCCAAFRAGASAVTHLFNAMSPLSHRAPGLVGAALDTPGVRMGLIADGLHVHPAAMRVALAARPTDIFLVTDAMATTGSTITEFTLNERKIVRSEGRLTLADGTLAGADLDMPRAIAVSQRDAGCTLEQAIAMATSRPAKVIGAADHGRLRVGAPLRAVLLAPDLTGAVTLDVSAR